MSKNSSKKQEKYVVTCEMRNGKTSTFTVDAVNRNIAIKKLQSYNNVKRIIRFIE